jgi:DNA-binding Lrp family transcriptional regulator
MAGFFQQQYQLDEIDLGIIERLKLDPMETSKSLAQHLKISQSSVGLRLRALDNRNIMKVLAQRDFRAEGYKVLANVLISITGRKLDDVANDLAAIEKVGVVMLYMGDPAISILAMAESLLDLQNLVADQISKIPGIRSVESMVISNIIKYESEYINMAKES